jgi:hypothetical protein
MVTIVRRMPFCGVSVYFRRSHAGLWHLGGVPVTG